jgi:hypothetical protein
MRRVLSFALVLITLTGGFALVGGTMTESPARALADTDADGKQEITTCAELFALATSGSFEIYTNGSVNGGTLDCNGTTQTPRANFWGTLDGNSVSITNINISCTADKCGIFQTLSTTASVSNLTLLAPVVTNPNSNYTGALAGEITAAQVSGIRVQNGTISGKMYTGSIAGYVGAATLSNLSSSAVVSGTSNVGGLVGRVVGPCSASKTSVTTSEFSGSVTGTGAVGGIVGYFDVGGTSLSTCKIIDSSNSGTVRATGNSGSNCYAGGITGWLNGASVENSHNSGGVVLDACLYTAGGIVGTMNYSFVQKVWNTGPVGNVPAGPIPAGRKVGGIAGNCFSQAGPGGYGLKLAYNTGAIFGSDSGGLMGVSGCSIQDSFSHAEQTTGGSLIGESTGMTLERTYGVALSSGAVTDLPAVKTVGAGTACTDSLVDTTSLVNNEFGRRLQSSGCAINTATGVNLKTQASFTNWNFSTVWAIDPSVNSGYPYLRNVGVTSLTPPTVTLTTATINATQNAVVQSTETGTAYLVDSTLTVSSLADITGAANDRWNQATISTANTNTNIAATGLSDGTYKAYATDAAGNLSAASTGTVTIDSTAPTATLTTATINATQNAVVQSTETGTAYLVDSTLTVSSLADITGAANDRWNQATISTANTNTNIAATGLSDGTYKAYATDAAGNLSAASTGTVTVATPDTTPPTASWTSPTSPSNSRTLTYTLTFSESVQGLATSDFILTGTAAAGCSATPSATTGTTITVTVTCTSDGTVTIELDANSTTDNANNTGPTTATTATTITIDTTQQVVTPNPTPPSPETTPPSTTAPTVPSRPSIEPPATLPLGDATSIRSDGTQTRSQMETITRNGITSVTITNGGTEVTVEFESTSLPTPFSILQGTSVSLSGTGYQPASSINIWLNSVPYLLGTTSVDDDGRFAVSVEIPGNFDLSRHTLQIEGLVPVDIVQSTFLGLEVVDRSDAMAPTLPETGSDSDPDFALVLIALGLVAMASRRLRVSGAGSSPMR